MTRICILNDAGMFLEEQDNQDEWKYKWEKDPITYALIRGTEDIEGNTIERRCMNLAMSQWDIRIPNTLKLVKFIEHADITIEFQSSKNDEYFEKRPSTLAYAYLPGQGDVSGKIVFNDDYVWSTDGKPQGNIKTFNLIAVMTHEIGHALGLRHSSRYNSERDIMHPSYVDGLVNVSDYDILKIRKKYGTETRGNSWRWYQRLDQWLKRRIKRG